MVKESAEMVANKRWLAETMTQPRTCRLTITNGVGLDDDKDVNEG